MGGSSSSDKKSALDVQNRCFDLLLLATYLAAKRAPKKAVTPNENNTQMDPPMPLVPFCDSCGAALGTLRSMFALCDKEASTVDCYRVNPDNGALRRDGEIGPFGAAPVSVCPVVCGKRMCVAVAHSKSVEVCEAKLGPPVACCPAIKIQEEITQVASSGSTLAFLTPSTNLVHLYDLSKQESDAKTVSWKRISLFPVLRPSSLSSGPNGSSFLVARYIGGVFCLNPEKQASVPRLEHYDPSFPCAVALMETGAAIVLQREVSCPSLKFDQGVCVLKGHSPTAVLHSATPGASSKVFPLDFLPRCHGGPSVSPVSRFCAAVMGEDDVLRIFKIETSPNPLRPSTLTKIREERFQDIAGIGSVLLDLRM